MTARILLLLILITPAAALGQSQTVFRGRPSVQVAMAGAEPKTTRLTAERAEAADCVISKIGGEYYWATRENRKMVLIDTPAFTLFLSVDGTGYVKVVKETMKSAASLVDDASAEYDYVEHLPVGLSSITYYGKRR